MLNKILAKIDRFYFVVSAVFVVLAIIIAFTAMSIFSSLAESQKIDDELLDSSIPRINKMDLDKAYKIVTEKENVPLDLKP